MATYLIMYQWYENTATGIIKASSEEQALYTFGLYVNKLDCNHQLEKKYGYGGSIGPFFYDEEEETFTSAFKKYLDSDDRGTFTIVEITEDTEGIITEKFVSGAPSVTGFYNGEKE